MQNTQKMRLYCLIILITALALVTAFGINRWRRMHAYDKIIAKAAAEHNLAPELIRAVIWRESGFKHNCRGGHGEIGLMQVTENAAREWAQSSGIVNFKKNDLFNPETNIQAGSWYLQRSIARWTNKPNPLPYALAEYNAGRSNAVRWAANDGGDANKFWDGITYPATKRYVRDILARLRRR